MSQNNPNINVLLISVGKQQGGPKTAAVCATSVEAANWLQALLEGKASLDMARSRGERKLDGSRSSRSAAEPEVASGYAPPDSQIGK